MTWMSVLVTCLLWVGGISWLIVYAFGLSPEVGWIIVGALGFLAVVTVLLLTFEVRHAIEVPDDADMEEVFPRTVSSSGIPHPDVTVLPVSPLPVFRVSGDRY
jgi:hypothetical protein